MINVAVFAVLALILGLACFYIHREKKRGAVCIGCPHAKTCQSHSCGGCQNSK